MYPSEKNTNHLTVRGGGGGVNPYGQPDRKISAFFFDDFPYLDLDLYPCFLNVQQTIDIIFTALEGKVCATHCWQLFPSSPFLLLCESR